MSKEVLYGSVGAALALALGLALGLFMSFSFDCVISQFNRSPLIVVGFVGLVFVIGLAGSDSTLEYRCRATYAWTSNGLCPQS